MKIPPFRHFTAQHTSLARRHTLSLRIVLLLCLLAIAGCAPANSDSPAGAAESPAPAMPFSPSSVIFEIIPVESEARFLIDEILQGEEKTVVGKTGQVSGQIAVDFADPQTAAVGPIQVDARTIETDNGFRNRAIQNRILLSGIYENITFTPAAVIGMPQEIVFGEALEFEITGDLLITTISQPVTFTVNAVPLSESRLEGRATTTINRGDFDLVVPSATGVAAVGEEVILEIDFVAEAPK